MLNRLSVRPVFVRSFVRSFVLSFVGLFVVFIQLPFSRQFVNRLARYLLHHSPPVGIPDWLVHFPLFA